MTPKPPVNDDEEYVTGTLNCTWDEFMDALRANGAEVQQVIIDTETDTFKPVAND